MAAPLTYAQLEGLWLSAAGGTPYGTKPWAALMAAIAEAESGGDPGALNPDDNGGRQSSFGLWQISTGTHAPPSPNWADPSTNAGLAVAKLQTEGLGAWGTYDSGAYKAYLSGSTTPDTNIPANPTSVGTESAAAAASDCLYGFGGVPGTSWISDVTGSGGNVGSFCILTRSQARGVCGALLLLAGAWIMVSGVDMAAAYAGAQTPAGKELLHAAVEAAKAAAAA